MISLATFFENPLPDARISIEDFKKFSEDHLARITVSTNPAVLSLVAATGSVHLAYFGSIGDVATAEAVRQARTKAVDAKLHEFVALVRKEEPGIAYARRT